MALLKMGRLPLSALRQFAAQPQGDCEKRNRLIQIVGEILKRPRLVDAISMPDGYITRDSLRAAASVMQGSSSPSLFSLDTFHGKGNHEVVLSFKEEFAGLRDPTKDLKFLFWELQYVEIAKLRDVMRDPYKLDNNGKPVAEPSTGMLMPEYSERCVYTAINLVNRPGLLSSLRLANSMQLLGRFCPPGYLGNLCLDLWLEQDVARKAR
ncbi:hypothetical protein [Pseudomonas poae]|nr:hypothetical protein [Pseudomonas poae]KRP46062.1 type III secretion effector protein [Pseudomonas poae]